MTVPVSAQWMDSTDCICMKRAFNMTVYLYWGQLLDGTSPALTHLLSALSCLSWSCNPCFNNPIARAASCKGGGRDSLNANIYPDSPELTCVSSVSGWVVVHVYTHAYLWAVQWIWTTQSLHGSTAGFLCWPWSLETQKWNSAQQKSVPTHQNNVSRGRCVDLSLCRSWLHFQIAGDVFLAHLHVFAWAAVRYVYLLACYWWSWLLCHPYTSSHLSLPPPLFLLSSALRPETQHQADQSWPENNWKHHSACRNFQSREIWMFALCVFWMNDFLLWRRARDMFAGKECVLEEVNG